MLQRHGLTLVFTCLQLLASMGDIVRKVVELCSACKYWFVIGQIEFEASLNYLNFGKAETQDLLSVLLVEFQFIVNGDKLEDYSTVTSLDALQCIINAG